MNQFTERYQTLSNADLLKIIDNPADYQADAVEAAGAELAGRQLSIEELESAKTEIELELHDKALKKERRQAHADKVRDITAAIVDAIHPIQQTSPSTNRIINFLSLVLIIMFLLTLFKEFSFIAFILFNRESIWDLSTPFYLLEIIIIPVFTFLFWLRKRLGWVLFCIYCSYLVTVTLVYFFMAMKHYLAERNMGLINLFPVASPEATLWNIVFFGACLWLICKNSVREVYQVAERSMVIIAGTTAAVSLGIIWGLVTRH